MNSHSVATTSNACRFASEAEGIDSLSALTIRAKSALSSFGVTCLSANMISNPVNSVSPGILFGQSWREWSRLYQRNGFAKVDPALRMLRLKNRPFTWREAISRFPSSAGERVMTACLDFTGCRDGLVVPVRESDGALLTAAFSGPDIDLSAEAKAAMCLIGLYYVTRGRELALDLHPHTSCPLTPRQLECLAWVKEGKTDSEIGAILKVSPRTAHHHVEAAKSKLGVNRRNLAADLAWRSGWLA